VARVRNGEFRAGELVPGTRYRVLGLLGVGGMGSVYEVEHIELGKRFVLKALLSDLARRQDLVARLRNEQRALGRLEHPSIVTVTDAGVTSFDVPYFVMERLDGETLAARLKRVGCFTLDEALGVAAGVLDGLAAAHEIGVVHRDVKPQNIFLATGLRPKILDFGVAKVSDASGAITARGVAVGTPRYMSPEQASGERVDGRSDIYAVGLVLFESLLGRGPFDDARDANEMLLAHLSRPVQALAGRVPGVAAETDALLATFLAKEPDLRPANASAAAALLRELKLRIAATGYASGVQRSATARLGPPAAPSPTTRVDGIAARHVRAAEHAAGAGTGDDAPTLARVAPMQAEHDTLVDETETRSQNGPTTATATLSDSPPAGTTRTEILPAIGSPLGNDHPTHTVVPATPTDGSHTVEPPLPAVRRARRTRARGRWTFAAFVAAASVAGAGVAWRAIGRTPSLKEPPVAVLAANGAAEPKPTAVPAAAEPKLAPVGDTAFLPPVPAAAETNHAATAARASAKAPTTAEPSVVQAVSTVSEAAVRRPPTKKKPQKAATQPNIPPGLPGSGL
jgi:serine/threonine-protein kinase